MTMTVDFPSETEAALREEAARQGMTPEELTRQAVMEKLIAGLKDRPVPQTLADIQLRRLPPPGKTAMQMVYQQLLVNEVDETDEDVLRALEELS